MKVISFILSTGLFLGALAIVWCLCLSLVPEKNIPIMLGMMVACCVIGRLLVIDPE
jgi:hypothetical protein